jgi:ERCC4-type nuclease
MPKETEFITRPYVLIIDTREQSTFDFMDIPADTKDDKTRGTIVLRTKRLGLKTGDYSIEGIQHRVAVERKSMEDLYNCVGADRTRFEKQLCRLNELESGWVVVEADLGRIMEGCKRSKLDPKTIPRSMISWQMDKYPNVHWWLCPSKRSAELVTFRILDRFWREHALEDI